MAILKGMKNMLFDALTDYCDKRYQIFGDKCGNENCTHPSGKCTGRSCQI